jgi:hypothetical protein
MIDSKHIRTEGNRATLQQVGWNLLMYAHSYIQGVPEGMVKKVKDENYTLV